MGILRECLTLEENFGSKDLSLALEQICNLRIERFSQSCMIL